MTNVHKFSYVGPPSWDDQCFCIKKCDLFTDKESVVPDKPYLDICLIALCRLWFWIQVLNTHKKVCWLFLGHCHRGVLQKTYRWESLCAQRKLFSLNQDCLNWMLFWWSNIFRLKICYLKSFPISQVIGKARVPIVKFVEKTSGVAFDIRFNCLPSSWSWISEIVMRDFCFMLEFGY